MFRRLLLLFAVLALAGPAHADQDDLAAAARSVVRVVLVATDGTDAYYVGHGSGILVAPDKVLTNAHVVELTRSESNLAIGIVPAEGKKSFGGKVIAFSPGNDLALIQLDKGRSGALPVATFYSGPPADGMAVTAIGYPGAVDRAQGLSLSQITAPLSAVKTSGTISAGRSANGFDTLLHTAPMAAGNSGGPLVDNCGRVVGVNSFGSMSDGNDAEYGFAVSNREVANFLRQAHVEFRRNGIDCQSMDSFLAGDKARTDAQAQADEANARSATARRAAEVAEARETVREDIISAREDRIALAAVLLAAGVLGIGAAGLTFNQGKRDHAAWYGGGAGVLLLGAFLTFLLRPNFSDIDDRMKLAEDGTANAAGAVYVAEGDNLCRIVPERSRITMSGLDDVPLAWTAGGCAGGVSQFASDGKQWGRVRLIGSDDIVAVDRFDPTRGELTIDRYFIDGATMEKARIAQGKLTMASCTGDPDLLGRLGQQQSEIRALLPPRPNERLVYRCGKGAVVQ